MRGWKAAWLLGAAFVAGPAWAADKPVYAPAPGWVTAVAVPPAPAKSDGAAVHVLLLDQQTRLDRDAQTSYTEVALAVQTPQGLSAGNISFPWRPETDTLTIHKVLIRRGGQVIDVLKDGQTFTVLRRETNLEQAELDGVLTANLQPEGLQVGDVLDVAVSVTSHDPVLGTHVEGVGAEGWSGAPIDHAHLTVSWPASLPVRLRATAALPAVKPVRMGDRTGIDLSLDHLQPVVLPNGAPSRYRVGRLVELSDYPSWAQLGALMAPLYAKAATLKPDGPLQAELARLKALPSPLARAEGALALVQDRVRYVALVMGAGGLTPADADQTWARRFGDCKGKTALLLALLHGLGIEAEPVVVNALAGDGIDQHLPMVALFNHVLVRATIAGRSYWLDGTRTGDTRLDGIRTPGFGWGLPLVAKDAALVRLLPAPLDKPADDTTVRIDASAGLSVPAPFHAEEVFRGDAAVVTAKGLDDLSPDARDRELRNYWRKQYDFVEAKTVAARFDPDTREETLTLDGAATMDWSRGGYETDGTGIGYHADFHRDAGPDRDAPFAVAYPFYNRVKETIVLPAGFAGARGGTSTDVDRTIAGVEYHRHSALTGTTFAIEKTEKSVAPEFAAAEAPAAQKALRDLSEQPVWVMKPAGYVETGKDAEALIAATPTTTQDLLVRGGLLLDRHRYDEALADFEKAVAQDPKNAYALANRALAHAWKRQTAEAQRDIAAALALDPRNSIALRAAGLAPEVEGDYPGAVASFTRALAVDPSDTWSLEHRSRDYRAIGRNDLALDDLAAEMKLKPNNAGLYLARANVLHALGRSDDAVAIMQQGVEADPANVDMHVAAGKLYAALGHRDLGMTEFDRALALTPEAWVYLNRAESRPPTDLAGRRADLDAALKLDPTLVPALADKARLLADAGDKAGALATWDKAVAAEPTDASLLVGRGVTRLRFGERAPAQADFAAARGKGPEAMILNNICWAKATSGMDLDAAVADCDAALARQPGEAAFLDSRGLAKLRLGRLDAAIADYDAALAKRPSNAGSLYGRAVAWARKGDKAKSAADLAAARKLDAYVDQEFAGYGVTL